jgi:hypothetical protein
MPEKYKSKAKESERGENATSGQRHLSGFRRLKRVVAPALRHEASCRIFSMVMNFSDGIQIT